MAAPLLLVTHERFVDHVAGPGHPERPARLGAALAGVEDLHLGSDLVRLPAEPAAPQALVRAHDEQLVDFLTRLDERGGGRIDADTGMGEASWEAAQLAAGAGLVALEALDNAAAEAAFCAIRPPGHHATAHQSMGFCLLNNLAVTAAALVERGDRPLIVDFDAHHGNGTQAIFYEDPNVLFVSFHQWPLYPGTGRADEVGSGAGAGTTVNLPVPPGATGDVYRRAWDEVVAPVVARFEPTHVLVSAGFDSHRRDPLTDLGLTSGDFADLTAVLLASAPPGQRLVFLEGGYDLDAVRAGTAATLGAIVGERHVDEAPTSGGPGNDRVAGWMHHHPVP